MEAPDLEHWLQERPPALAEVLRGLAAACACTARRMACADAGAALRDSEAERCFVQALSATPDVAGWASEKQSEPSVSAEHGSRGAYLVAYDALDLDGQSDADLPEGSVFSVLPHLFRGTPASAAAFMQPGRRQLACGYALYGANPRLVLCVGQGVHEFVLDTDDGAEPGRWLLARSALRLPAGSAEVTIDMSRQRLWEKPVQRYVAECSAGAAGQRGREFALRWSGGTVAQLHRVLTRGGIYIDPRDNAEPYRPGRRRLLVEANAFAWLVEQAGGSASTGSSALLELVPDALHQKVPVILGSRDEVERLVGYHADPSENVSWQLFKTRSLFIQPNA